MPIYEITSTQIRPLPQTTFSAENIGERADLQRLLCRNIGVLGADLMVLAEEFSDWEDSRRRVDILAIDRSANLVVIELKRTEDGSHMELQALRYAAMVSNLKFDRAVAAHASFRAGLGLDGDAREAILAFLGRPEMRDADFAQDVRIVLVSADFSKEVTSTVLWLNTYDLDITCIRMRPHKGPDGRVLVDCQQIIPLPEAAEYQVKLREKQQIEREERGERNVLQRFWTTLLTIPAARATMAGRATPGNQQWIAGATKGYSFSYFARQHDAQVEVYLDSWGEAENLRRFRELLAKRDEIEAITGPGLEWMELPGKRACRIRKIVANGGYRSPEDRWPELHEALVAEMQKLEKAFVPRLP